MASKVKVKKDEESQLFDARVSSLQRRIKAVSGDLGKARAAGSWSAVAQFHLRAATLEEEVYTAKVQRLKAKAGAKKTTDMTPEERQESEQKHAREVADIHLQIYVVEYLQRHPAVHLATDSGRIEIMAG